MLDAQRTEGTLAGLPIRQARFIDEYLVDLNGAQSAIRAGYSCRSARQIASEILSKPDVQEVIRRRCKETEARLQISRDDVIRGLQAAYEEARLRGDPIAMIAAMKEIAAMMGFYPD
ncbi:MAG: terminase small subunit [bacterium]